MWENKLGQCLLNFINMVYNIYIHSYYALRLELKPVFFCTGVSYAHLPHSEALSTTQPPHCDSRKLHFNWVEKQANQGG